MTTGDATAASGRFAEEAYAATADAFARAPGSWESAVLEAIASLFEFLAERPDQTRACLLRPAGAPGDAFARRERAVERFAQLLLQPGFEAVADPPPPVLKDAIAGGIHELVCGYARERRLAELPAAVPNAAVVVLSPFVGNVAAHERANAASLQTRR